MYTIDSDAISFLKLLFSLTRPDIFYTQPLTSIDKVRDFWDMFNIDDKYSVFGPVLLLCHPTLLFFYSPITPKMRSHPQGAHPLNQRKSVLSVPLLKQLGRVWNAEKNRFYLHYQYEELEPQNDSYCVLLRQHPSFNCVFKYYAPLPLRIPADISAQDQQMINELLKLPSHTPEIARILLALPLLYEMYIGLYNLSSVLTPTMIEHINAILLNIEKHSSALFQALYYLLPPFFKSHSERNLAVKDLVVPFPFSILRP